ncbi:helix-turn-helix domain-containing protein [Frigidibacter sp. RF13]|uniref:GlxA family transcriptional regulator n=1 Tax=Frigidibacter sp. RF13 TaxID=2997340 RepID=UPI00226D8C0F|nr:helix-turn-helix domain-containing protein [Frigidibacter sp. RF13]MCY1126582.1 helix-turn-helix domain-containing protein [Frigidibacter sp. RF13]
MTDTSPIQFGFLLFPGFPMACMTSAIEPLRAANEITGRRIFAWRLIAETRATVRSSAEIGFEPDATLQEVVGLDHLYLLSPPTADYGDPRRSPARLRWLDRTGVTLGAFSGGIFPLARAGLMEGRTCSVHWCYEAAFKARFPDVDTTETVICRDRRRATVSGSGAVFGLMLRLIEERLGRDCMTEVACWFQHPVPHEEDMAQKTPVGRSDSLSEQLAAPVRRAIDLFSTHIEDPLRIPDVAEAVGLSNRHFERLFKQETGQSPLRYYHQLRLRKARQRVLYSKDGLRDIAVSVGYLTTATLARHYTEMFGLCPRDERRLAQAG